MSPLDLSVPTSKAWRQCLPEDFQKDIPDDSVDVPDDVAALFDGNKGAEEVAILIGQSDYQFSKTQGMMVLCWLADSPAPIATCVQNKSIAAVTDVLIQGAIAMRLTKGIIARNADVILSINKGTLHIPDEALVPPVLDQTPAPQPTPSMGMGGGQ